MRTAGIAFGSKVHMPRPPRLNIAGATYHVMNRGNRKACIFEDDRDCKRFLRILIEVSVEFTVDVLAGCLMINHFHLLVSTPSGNLSDFMQQLEGRFGQYSNWRHGRVGHVFGGRFRSPIIESDLHLLTAAGYIFRNPVVAGLVPRMEDWKWSTYAATAGLAPVPSYLSLKWLDALCPSATRRESQRKFREIMASEKPVDSYLQSATPALGSEPFRRAVRSYIGETLYQSAVPRAYKGVFRPPLGELIPRDLCREERALAIQRAHVVYGYRLAEIARSLAIHPSTAGRMMRDFRATLDVVSNL
jgi:putative transposase